MQKDLFGGNAISQVGKIGKRKEARPMPDEPNENKCGNCVFLFRHTYNQSMKYCRQYKQEGTAYGKLKIKSRDKACIKFEQKPKGPNVKT